MGRYRNVLNQFDENTFTTELHQTCTKEEIKEAEDAGIIQRHPGIFGSHSSYYRTPLGEHQWVQRECDYPYIKTMYGTDFRVGMRVRFEESRGDDMARDGTVDEESPKHGTHYVMVKFDGELWPLPCHPGSLMIPT